MSYATRSLAPPHVTAVPRRVGLPRHRFWASILVAVLVLVPALWVSLRPDPARPTPVERYPGTPPAEWGPGATWASPPLASGTKPVVVGTDEVALLTSERRLLVVAASDGGVRWDARLPEGEIRTPPTPTRIDGRPVLVAHVGNSLSWWTVEEGAHDSVDLPDGSVVSVLGESPLVAVGGQEVMAVTGDRPRTVQVPDGATAVAAHEDGTVTAAGPSGWWHLGPEGVNSSGPWENPSGVTGTVAGYLSGFILVVRPGSPAVLEIHADRTTDVRYVADAPIVLPGNGPRLTWHPSPSGSWGILGRALVDLRTATVEDLGAWSTRVVTADRAYGHIDGQTVVVGPSIPRGVVAPGESVPDALTVSGALVRGPAPATDETTGTDPRRPGDVAYLLPPRRTAS